MVVKACGNCTWHPCQSTNALVHEVQKLRRYCKKRIQNLQIVELESAKESYQKRFRFPGDVAERRPPHGPPQKPKRSSSSHAGLTRQHASPSGVVAPHKAGIEFESAGPSVKQLKQKLLQQREEQVISENIRRALTRGQQKHLAGGGGGDRAVSSCDDEESSMASEATVYRMRPRHHHQQERRNDGGGAEINSDTDSYQRDDLDSRCSVSMRTTAESESTKSFVGGYIAARGRPQQQHVRRRESAMEHQQQIKAPPPLVASSNTAAALRRAESFQHAGLTGLPTSNSRAAHSSSNKAAWPKLFSFGDSSAGSSNGPQLRPSGPSDYNAFLVYDPDLDDVNNKNNKQRDGRGRQRNSNNNNKPVSRRSSASSSSAAAGRSANNNINGNGNPSSLESASSSSNHYNVVVNNRLTGQSDKKTQRLSLSQSNLLDDEGNEPAGSSGKDWTIKWRYPRVRSSPSVDDDMRKQGRNNSGGGGANNSRDVDDGTFVINKNNRGQSKTAKLRQQISDGSPPLPKGTVNCSRLTSHITKTCRGSRAYQPGLLCTLRNFAQSSNFLGKKYFLLLKLPLRHF